MVLRRIEPFSCAKVMAIVDAFVGLIIGLVFSVISLFLSAAGVSSEFSGTLGLVFGVGAIIFVPIFYAVFGFVCGLIVAFFYNLVARMVGGLELDLVPTPAKPEA